jgi:site-specific DNA recombinase
MRVAVYARKSTDEGDKHETAKSVTRQLESARAYAAGKNWTVCQEFVDDGISGAYDESRRPGLRSMLDAAAGHQFDVLVVAADDRLARDQWVQATILARLAKAKVRLVYYQESREVDLSGSVGKFLESVRSFGSEFFRESATRHMVDALKAKAKAGWVHGGVTYGYVNVRHAAHVGREINEPEAAVIRLIYERYAAGMPPSRIAQELNRRQVIGPAKTRGWRDGDWTKGLIRDILHRESYHGAMISTWDGERITVAQPHLQIIPDALWAQTRRLIAHQRAVYLRSTNGQVYGRPAVGIESSYLLTGMLLCYCGAAMTLRSSPTTGRRIFVYRCRSNISGRLRRNQRQLAQCQNTKPVPMALADQTILGLIERTMLRADVVAATIAECLRRLDPLRRSHERTVLEQDLARLTKEIGNLSQAIADGQPAGVILSEINTRDARRQAITAELERLNHAEALATLDLQDLENKIRTKLADFQGLAGRHIQQTRQILRLLIPDRLTMTPISTGYRFVGEGVLAPLLQGVLPNLSRVVTPAGFEPAISTLKGSGGEQHFHGLACLLPPSAAISPSVQRPVVADAPADCLDHELAGADPDETADHPDHARVSQRQAGQVWRQPRGFQ